MERPREKYASVLHEVAREIGIEYLKTNQREAIETFVAGRDLLVTLPTGYGKSLIYAILPTLFDKIRDKYSKNNAYDVVILHGCRQQRLNCCLCMSADFHNVGAAAEILIQRDCNRICGRGSNRSCCNKPSS